MAERKALVQIDGQLQELPSGDTLTGAVSTPEVTPFNFEFDPDFVPATAITVNGLTFSGGTSGTDVNKFVVSTDPIPSGKWYWEVQLTSTSNGGLSLVCGGVADADVRSDFDTNEFYADGIALRSGSGTATLMYSHLDGAQANIENGIISQTPTMCFAFDADTGEMWMTYNGNVDASGTATRQKTNWTGEKYLAVSATDTDVTGTVVLDAPSMNYTIPEGFSALGTSGTPVPAMSGSEIVSAIDTELGQTDWKTGGGGAPSGRTFNGDFSADYVPTNWSILTNTVTNDSGGNQFAVFAVITETLPEGQWYWEVVYGGGLPDNSYVGLTPAANLSDYNVTSAGTGLYQPGIGWNSGGTLGLGSGTTSSALPTWTEGDILRFAYDTTTGELWVGVNATAPDVAGTADVTESLTDPHITVGLRDNSLTAQVLTDSADLNYDPPTGFLSLAAEGSTSSAGASAVAELTDMNITPANLTTGDLNRPLGLVSLDPTPSYGLLTQLQSLPVMGGYEIIAENDFSSNSGTSLMAPNAHLYDEIHMYFFNVASGGGLFSGIYPDGINPSSYAALRMRIFGNNAAPDTGNTETVGIDKMFIVSGITVSRASGRLIWRGMKSGIPLSCDKIIGQESGDYFHHEHNIYQTLAEVQGLDFNTNSGNITSGTVIIVGVRNAVQIMAAPYNYTGTPGGVVTLGRFVVPVNARIRSGAQGQFKNGTNNSGTSSLNINIAGGSTIGTISLPTSGNPVVNITADTDLTAGDVLEIVTTQAETFTDLYGSLLLEGRG